MGELFPDLMELMKKPAVVETLIDVLLCAVPIWLAVMIGLLIGWSWRPRWTGLVFLGLRSRFRLLWAPPGFGARRLWFAFTALSAFSVCRKLWSSFRSKGAGGSENQDRDLRLAVDSSLGSISRSASVDGEGLSFSEIEREKDAVTEKDLDHLLYLLDGKVGDTVWQNMMERTTSNMTYQAWRHEPEVGPVIYRSRTVFEDATPELVRDFFWDDDFRCKWDPMLTYFKILEECPHNGAMIVHWIKKFPFFCSDREYIIGRRIWESGKTYYCVTKGVPYPSLPKNEKPRRVELYFSSWRIRAVESRKQDGSACEVTLVHYEDMGIPKDVAKMGVRHGMWGAVKKLHNGMRAYQAMKKTGESSLSRSALMAKITTKVAIDSSPPSDSEQSGGEEEMDHEIVVPDNRHQGLDWKWVVIGGVAVVCGLQTGLIGKALLFGAARRIGRR